jgi:hypothetical protein
VSGLDAAMEASAIPVLAAADDDIAAGTPGDAVGFGSTDGTSMPDGRRRRGSLTTLAVVDAPRVADFVLVDKRTGAATCLGDSGGPFVVDLAGAPRVAAVTSFGVGEGGPCGALGGFGRVSSIEADFIDPVLGGTPPAPASCLACGAGLDWFETGPCWSAVSADYLQLLAFNRCVMAMPVAACREMEPVGAAAFDRNWDCLIDECGDLCSAGACCAEIESCMDEATCRACLRDGEADPAPCADHAGYGAARRCLESSCATECSPVLDLVPPDRPSPSTSGWRRREAPHN